MQEAVDHLYDLPRFTQKNSLAHTRRLMALLGNPCADRPIIHVAGSNGKGSVCCFLYHMIRAGGATAAMFTSPHLVDIRERFQMNGRMASEAEFLSAYEEVQEAVETLRAEGEPHPTFFEYVYAMAMLIFEAADVDWIILETGLGGRLDATNCAPTPVLAVLTSIALEHTEILGDTLESIAAEKAGILKPGVPVVYAAGDPAANAVITQRAEALGCETVPVAARTEADPRFETFYEISKRSGNAIDFSLVSDYDGTTIWSVSGQALYQAQNAALAVTALRTLRRLGGSGIDRMDDDTLRRGLRSADWPGRMQRVRPDLWLDGAHNPAGITAFLASAREIVREDTRGPLLLVGMATEKDQTAAAALLAQGLPWAGIAVTAIPGTRAGDPADLAALLTERTDAPVETYGDCREALDILRNRQQPGQTLFCTGSLYMIGALLEALAEPNGGRDGL